MSVKILPNVNMTFDELRSRATAAELTLINSVIRLMEDEISERVRLKAANFINKNPPPYRDTLETTQGDSMRSWFKRFSEELKP